MIAAIVLMAILQSYAGCVTEGDRQDPDGEGPTETRAQPPTGVTPTAPRYDDLWSVNISVPFKVVLEGSGLHAFDFNLPGETLVSVSRDPFGPQWIAIIPRGWTPDPLTVCQDAPQDVHFRDLLLTSATTHWAPGKPGQWTLIASILGTGTASVQFGSATSNQRSQLLIPVNNSRFATIPTLQPEIAEPDPVGPWEARFDQPLELGLPGLFFSHVVVDGDAFVGAEELRSTINGPDGTCSEDRNTFDVNPGQFSLATLTSIANNTASTWEFHAKVDAATGGDPKSAGHFLLFKPPR